MSTTTLETYAASILVVDDHASARESMADILRCAGYAADTAPSAVDALKRIEDRAYDVIVTDLRMPGMSGLELIERLNRLHVDSQVVMITAHASVDSAVDAMRRGAFDYIEKPIDADQLEGVVERAVRQAGPRSTVPTSADDPTAMLIGDSQPMTRLKESLRRIGPTDETVLITGESGVGKELVARSLHALSQRANGPLVSMNCPALSPQLMESELFGHVKGAFTSAEASRVGRFELADQGTIFLDEVTEVDTSLQAKLLRVLQERSFERVGDCVSQSVDVRVVAATNRDLKIEVQAGNFRQDLFFRLAVVPLHVAPLRERERDVLQLAEHFQQQVAARLHRDVVQFNASAEDLLLHYHWPGNVRELENLVTRSAVLSDRKLIDADDLRPWLMDDVERRAEDAANGPRPSTSSTIEPGMRLQDMEQKLIEATLQQFDGHREKTAKALGIGVRTLTNKLRAYGYAPRANTPTRAA